MTESGDCLAEFHGTGFPLDAVTWELDSHESDRHAFVDLCFNFGELEAELSFEIEDAEQFIVQFRDEVVRAKQRELEWQTDTDSQTGVPEECE
jgi:hypothetical protein